MVRAQAARVSSDKGAPQWVTKVERLSQLCEAGVSKTHIALSRHGHGREESQSPGRPICDQADARQGQPERLFRPHALPLGPRAAFGGTRHKSRRHGPRTSQNQPYFRMERLDDGTPVHAGGRAAFDYMVTLVQELHELRSEEQALGALRAFIGVRMGYQPRYIAREGASQSRPSALKTQSIIVQADSEHGKRAQAVVAGLLDVFASPPASRAAASMTRAANIPATFA